MEMIEEGTFVCDMCGETFSDVELSLSHFAGLYCKKCSIKYKKQNSRICRKCGKPEWKCVC